MVRSSLRGTVFVITSPMGRFYNARECSPPSANLHAVTDRSARVCTLGVALLAWGALASCQSAPAVFEESRPRLEARLQRLSAAASPSSKPLAWSSVSPRFCPVRACRGTRGVNARVIDRGTLLEIPRTEHTVHLSDDSTWLTTPRALLRTGRDLWGRPLRDWYGPTLRRELDALMGTRYVLVVDTTLEVHAWTPLGQELVELAERSVEIGMHGDHDLTFLDGVLKGRAWLWDVQTGLSTPPITFASTHEVRPEPYRDHERGLLIKDLERDASKKLRAALTKALGKRSPTLPFLVTEVSAGPTKGKPHSAPSPRSNPSTKKEPRAGR